MRNENIQFCWRLWNKWIRWMCLSVGDNCLRIDSATASSANDKIEITTTTGEKKIPATFEHFELIGPLGAHTFLLARLKSSLVALRIICSNISWGQNKNPTRKKQTIRVWNAIDYTTNEYLPFTTLPPRLPFAAFSLHTKARARQSYPQRPDEHAFSSVHTTYNACVHGNGDFESNGKLARTGVDEVLRNLLKHFVRL